jgi:Uma2 family endonuclease
MTIAAMTAQRSKKGDKKEIDIPTELIYEILNGNPIYYRNYRDVLNHEKTLDDVMATGTLQTLILSAVYDEITPRLKPKGLKCLFNEVGIHISTKNNLSCDLVVFEKTALATIPHDNHYYAIPPKIVIEVDTDGDFTDSSFEQYFFEKSKKLLDFGAEKVIWILTASQTVTVATPDGKWVTQHWNKPIEILEGEILVLTDIFHENEIKI